MSASRLLATQMLRNCDQVWLHHSRAKQVRLIQGLIISPFLTSLVILLTVLEILSNMSGFWGFLSCRKQDQATILASRALMKKWWQ